MGVSVATEGGGNKHRRRSLDADVNLVPFIDLLSMCICFLLMTAVWIELGSVQVKQLVGTEASDQSQKAPLDFELKFTSPTALEVAVKKNGKLAKKLNIEASTSEERATQLKTQVLNLMPQLGINVTGDIKTIMPNVVSSAKVTPHIGVPYGDLVSVMDALRSQGILNLGVVPLPVRN